MKDLKLKTHMSEVEQKHLKDLSNVPFQVFLTVIERMKDSAIKKAIKYSDNKDEAQAYLLQAKVLEELLTVKTQHKVI